MNDYGPPSHLRRQQPQQPLDDLPPLPIVAVAPSANVPPSLISLPRATDVKDSE